MRGDLTIAGFARQCRDRQMMVRAEDGEDALVEVADQEGASWAEGCRLAQVLEAVEAEPQRAGEVPDQAMDQGRRRGYPHDRQRVAAASRIGGAGVQTGMAAIDDRP